MRTEAIERIDGFPYRHRVRELMTSPAVTAPADARLRETMRILTGRSVSSVVVVDDAGCAVGIVTERDVLRTLDRAGPDGMALELRAAMSAPVVGVPPEAFIYRAVGRMDRLGVRHLPVLDAQGRPLGMLTARTLLALRSRRALAIGDEIDVAGDAVALRSAHDRLPGLAQSLLADETPATAIAAVIAAVTRDMTARAADLALAAMAAAGKGPPPCRWCLLVLGSAGRGETLLAPDQDNALILDPPAGSDPATVDAWFADFALRVNACLDAAGIPLCRGGVMAGEPAFRRTVEGWRQTIGEWLARPDGAAVLAADIFFDLAPVSGDATLAETLRHDALRAASAHPAFLVQLATGCDGARQALGWFGRFRLTGGRVDLKATALRAIVGGIRVLALRHAIAATATDERLRALQACGGLREADSEMLGSAQSVVVEAILRQQLEDLAAGRTAGSRVDPSRLGRVARRRLHQAVASASLVAPMVESALTA